MTFIGVATALMMGLALFMILYKKYEDGFVGRFALATMFLAGVIVLIGEHEAPWRYESAPLELKIMIGAMLVFMIRHVARVLWFTLGPRHLGTWDPSKTTAIRPREH